VNRGAETAFEAIGEQLAHAPDTEVTLFGSGNSRPGTPYHFVHVPCTPRERFEFIPAFPLMRSETVWEELSFVRNLSRRYTPSAFDVTITCSYPFLNWYLIRKRNRRERKPKHVFITQNGDWPCFRKNSEFRWFQCDGLVCTNEDYFNAHRKNYTTALIPNGVDPSRFYPGPGDRKRFDIPSDRPVVLMVSALVESKRVVEGIQAVAMTNDLFLVVAGDGPMRSTVDSLGERLLGDRFRRISVERSAMPQLYRSADLFLHMCIDEPSANAYIEAMATGLPVITHDRTVTRWTFEDTAELVDTTKLERVAEMLHKAVSCDPERRQRLRELACRRFDWKCIGTSYREFLETVCGK
jgi:glycosyltransferase involved in cell wall biosynthesis